MTTSPSTVLLVLTHSPDPLAAIAASKLPVDLAGAAARLITRHGWRGQTEDLAAELGVSDRQRQRLMARLDATGYTVRHRRSVGRRQWQHVIAITDTPGTLPPRHELWALADASDPVDNTEPDIHPDTADVEHSPPGPADVDLVPAPRPAPGSTTRADAVACDDTDPPPRPASRQGSPSTPATSTSATRRHVKPVSGCLPAQAVEAPAHAVRREATEPVSDPQAKPHRPRRRRDTSQLPPSVVSSVAQLRGLTLLENLPRPAGSSRWVSPEDVLAHLRLFNPDTAESVLALLGGLRLPFWLLPPALTLTGHGWTVEEIGLLLEDVHEVGTRPASLAENRLRRAGEGRLKRPAARDDGEARSAAAPSSGTPWPAVEDPPGTAPWDRQPEVLWDGSPVPLGSGHRTSPARGGLTRAGAHRWCDPSVDCGH